MSTQTLTTSQKRRERRHQRVRTRVKGTGDRPRLSVFRSARYITAALIDDASGRTLCAVHSRTIANKKGSNQRTRKVEEAYQIGRHLAEKAVAQGVTQVVFDRGGYRYHGRVRALAEGGRDGGLIF